MKQECFSTDYFLTRMIFSEQGKNANLIKMVLHPEKKMKATENFS